MKINTLLTIITLWFFTSCQDDNNITPNSLVTEALQNKYPTAEQIKWDTEKAYITANFQKDQLIHTAWFDHFGQWYMTEIELNQKEKLPEAVRSAFEHSEYKDGRIDDIDLLERLDAENIYVIEVDKDGHEYHLCYSEDGILVKTILDNEKDDYEDYLPTDSTPKEILAFIEENYPEARIVDIEIEQQYIEVEIIHNQKNKDVIFNAQKEWTNTHYDIKQTEIEEIVLESIKQSEYQNHKIDDIEKYETPSGIYYLIEFDENIKIKIDTNGQIINT